VRSIIRIVIIILIVAVIPLKLFAWSRSSSSVPPDSEYYRDLDKIVAARLVKPTILGQRPYPRSEFARMAIEATQSLEKIDSGEPHSYSDFVRSEKRLWQARVSLRRLSKEFAEDIADLNAPSGEAERYRVHPLEKFYLEGRYLNSPPLTIIPNNGRGTIQAEANPLGDYNLGRHAIDGATSAIEPVARFEATKFFSGYVKPRFEVDSFRSGDMQAHAYLQNAYGTFKVGNFSFKAGRDSQMWGYGARGSLLYSTNPRPLDGMWVTNPTPARLPWILKYLGEWRYTLYGFNLGPEYPQKWAWITGYKISALPCQYVEFGFGHSVMMGGEGAISPGFVDVIGEFFGFRPAGTSGNDPNLTNHLFEVDLLVRIPGLRGSQIYGGFVLEDKWKSIEKTMKHGMSYLGGVYFPALNRSGSLDLRMEYTRNTPLPYRHGFYSAGYTENRKIIGSDAGPDADNAHILFRQTFSDNAWFGLSFDWDYRRSDRYVELVQANGLAGDVVKTASGPTDVRYRVMTGFHFNASSNVKVNLSAGYERAFNIFYIDGMDRNNYLAGVILEINLDRFFGFSSN